MSSIHQRLKPKTKDLGDDFVVRRTLPQRKQQMVGPFIFWDHMGPTELFGEKELKVRAHPHIGLATITYLFHGEIMHRDSLGNTQAIRPGEVNWMTAGKGIVHSERSQALDQPMQLEGIQLWLALPKDQEDRDPGFYHSKESELPQFEQGGIQFRLIAGEFLGHNSSVPTYSPLFYLNAKSSEGGVFSHQLNADHDAAIYVIEGQVEVETETLERFDMLTFKPGSHWTINAKPGAEFMIFGGQMFSEPRYLWWNLVSSSKDKVEAAKKDWASGRFDKVVDEEEWIPLPTEESVTYVVAASAGLDLKN